jgi:mono/diheme cytochrome c family protein
VARPLTILVGLALLGAGSVWMLTAPKLLDAATLAAFPSGDAARGEAVFWVSGCASCHATPGSDGDARLVLAGGLELKTDFGTFVAPNISPSPANGIGGWTQAEFANAMIAGVTPSGAHYFPAFPWNAYQRMTHQDVADLWAYLQTLPASENRAPPHDVGFPFNIRRAIGGWKLLFQSDPGPVVRIESTDPAILRGQYLVEGPGHCGECHTPRNALGGPQEANWLGGGENPDGPGRIPNITPGSKSIGSWSQSDIAAYLETGFTPEFDTVGGSMVSVQKNMAKLPKADLEAIAAYLKAVPVVVDP